VSSVVKFNHKEYKEFTKDTAKKYHIRDGMKQNNICVFGSEAKLTEDKDLFKTTIRPIE
jgi:hypothetical protein